MRSLLLAAALLAAPSALAQVSAQQGQLELGGSASFSSTDGDANFVLSPSVGYFVTDAIQAGLETVYVKNAGQSGNGTIGPFVAYHLGTPAQALRPFVQAQVGIALSGDDAFSATGSGGVKYFFVPGGALRAQAFATTGEEVTFGALGGVSIFF